VRQVWPEGPYLFYGFSAGGLIAFEMACQLQSAGHLVGFVGLGDTAAPPTRPPARRLVKFVALRDRAQRNGTGLMRNVFARLGAHANLALNPTQHSTRVARRRMRQAIAAGAPVAVRSRTDFVADIYWSMGYRYRPTGQYNGPMLLVRARRSSPERDLGWSRWRDGGVDIVDVDTPHAELHTDGYAGQVAQALRASIDQALATQPTAVELAPAS
jgi:thioesterase domain-containing protein